tara:strand:+ start:1533 stop:1634 length:102 start_codon:yes stop_codon:yes gene_type:complete
MHFLSFIAAQKSTFSYIIGRFADFKREIKKGFI